jgi:hypothetical protein
VGRLLGLFAIRDVDTRTGKPDELAVFGVARNAVLNTQRYSPSKRLK